MVIDEAIMSTEEKFGIIIRAIQDDTTLLGDTEFMFTIPRRRLGVISDWLPTPTQGLR